MKPLSERYSTIIGMVALGQPGDTDRDVWHEVAALESRIEALERLRQLVENDKGHIFCACGRCEETLKQLAALRSEEEKDD